MRQIVALIAVIAAGLACSPAAEDSALGDPAPQSARQFFPHPDGSGTLAVLAGKTLHLSAVVPADTQATIGDQTRSAMERLGEALGTAGADYARVVSCHVFLADMESYAEMNPVYGSFFSEGSYPARTTVEVLGLPENAGVQLMCVAYVDAEGIAVIRPPEDEIPAAMGPYSPAVRAGDRVYLSGQGGRDPMTGDLPASAAAQADQTLQTVGVILRAAGLGYEHAVQASSYFPSITDPSVVSGAFEAIVSPGGAPSHSSVPLSRLPGDIAVEITVLAANDSYITRLFMHDEPPGTASSPVSLTGGAAYTSATPGIGDTFQAQVRDAVGAQAEALGLAFLDLADVVRVVAYLSDMADFPELRMLLGESFPGGMPALTAVQSRGSPGSMVSLEMIAVQ